MAAPIGGYSDSEAAVAPLNVTSVERLDSRLTAKAAILPASPERPIGGLSKRLMDIFASSAALLMLAPFLIVIALLVRLESRGPVLFVQRRGGYRGRTFKIFKFRTMRTLEDGDAIEQAVPGDPRVTRLGSILRRTSLDELPQLLNVLKGEMSLVGPRPHAIAHDLLFRSMDPNYLLRQIARPGITGLAQVSGSRGPLTNAEQVRRRVRLDTAYIAKRSLALDIGIILRSVRAVFVRDDEPKEICKTDGDQIATPELSVGSLLAAGEVARLVSITQPERERPDYPGANNTDGMVTFAPDR